jgi:hypothetical protein
MKAGDVSGLVQSLAVRMPDASACRFADVDGGIRTATTSRSAYTGYSRENPGRNAAGTCAVDTAVTSISAVGAGEKICSKHAECPRCRRARARHPPPRRFDHHSRPVYSRSKSASVLWSRRALDSEANHRRCADDVAVATAGGCRIGSRTSCHDSAVNNVREYAPVATPRGRSMRSIPVPSGECGGWYCDDPWSLGFSLVWTESLLLELPPQSCAFTDVAVGVRPRGSGVGR